MTSYNNNYPDSVPAGPDEVVAFALGVERGPNRRPRPEDGHAALGVGVAEVVQGHQGRHEAEADQRRKDSNRHDFYIKLDETHVLIQTTTINE